MHLTGGLHCNERRKEICDTAATHHPLGKRCYVDAPRAAVMAYVKQLVRDGFAQCAKRGNGAIELTLSTGEVFHLGKTSITRII